jgi:hypothetical protein
VSGRRLTSLDPCPPAAAAAARRKRGRVPIAERSLGGVGPEGVFGGEEDGGGVRSRPRAARTILLFHIISARSSPKAF